MRAEDHAGAPGSRRFQSRSDPGSELHYLHWGDPQTPRVVLLHGGGANAHWWDHVAPAFADRFFVAALDFRGHGDSDYPEETRVGAFSDDLDDFLAHLDDAFGTVGPPALIGHSMGGGVAIDHAANRGGLRGLVAIDVSRGASRRSRRTARLALALRRTYETRDEAIARYRFLPASDRAEETLREHIAACSVRKEQDGRFGFKFDPRWFSLPPKPRPDPSRIDCPFLLVRGGDSPLLTAEGAEELAREVPDGRTVCVEAAGHHVHLDQPGPFLAVVSPFLDGLGRAQRQGNARPGV